MPNITGTLNGDEINSAGEYTGSFTLTNTSSVGQGNQIGTDKLATFDASKGETKTDGTLKTADEYHVYGAANGVQPQNISIRLWKRIS